MSRKITRSMALAAGLAAAVGVAAPAYAQAGCDRAMLQDMADKIVQAQKDGNTLLIPRGNWSTYYENFNRDSMISGTISQPLDVKWHRALLDTTTCRIALEMVVLDPKPYVIATQVSTRGGSVNSISSIITDEGDWLFDAEKTYEYARREDWSPIPEARRNTRKEIQAAADAYLNLFKDKETVVPWGTPCARLEGGVYTGRGQPDDSCNVGVPSGVDLVERDYVIDEELGAVDVFLKFGASARPDSHRFRIEDGKIRFVHTVTFCGEEDNCGFGPFADMIAKNPGMQPDPALLDK